MNTETCNILVVDDDEDVLLAAKLLLKQHFSTVHTEKDPEQIPSLLKNSSYDVVLLDMNFTRDVSSGTEGFLWLDRIQQLDPAAVVILITAFGDVELAVKAIKEGAIDFITKPWQNEKLIATISAAVNLRKTRNEVSTLQEAKKQLSRDLDHGFTDFIGTSEPMKRVFSIIRKVAATDANVLILGENGTGKELVARELHRNSHRADEVFISVDIGSLTDTLFESELFGYVKGAFTDARDDRAGRFEIASGGTLFLDEIGNVPPPLQAKLLTVLENRQVTRIGSSKPIPVDIRLICATNMPIQEMSNNREFREDLLYRINTVAIELPPLRDRTEDIPLLAEHFLRKFAQKYNRKPLRLNAATVKKLEKHNWPGNVRELRHSLERAVILSETDNLQPADFLLTPKEAKSGELVFDKFNLEDVEKIVIRKAVDKHSGNISRAAKELGLTRTSLYRRLEKHGI